jgi:NADH-quinone oxidoreductase subunit D
MATNIKTVSEVEQINRIRQSKIIKEISDKDVSVIFEDPLDNDMILNMGPQHPATHGVLRVLLRLDGEVIVKCVPELGYLHRGYEKIAENMTYHDFIPYSDRMDYLSPLANNVAIALAIDNALGIEAPPRATWIRTLVFELARISSHLMAMGSTAMDVGALTLFLWTFVEREKLYDIFERIAGARFTTSYARIGGVANDIDEETFKMLRKWAEEFPAELEKMGKLAHRNRIFIDRMAGIGVIDTDKCIKLGITGPIIRATGMPKDLRRDNPYLIYDELDFDVITYPDGDVWSRYMVRVDEMKESLKMVFQILDKMPEGEVKLKNTKAVLPSKKDIYTKMEELISDFMLINFGAAPEPGETYTAVEASKGELGFFIVSDGTGHPWRMKIRSPSASNLQGLPHMAEGSMIADIVAIIGTIDPIMGEADK